MTAKTPRLPPILYEDDALLVFDKPSGLLVVPDRWDRRRSHLLNLARSHLASDIVNVHRLDGPTSGLLVFAKSPEFARRLSTQFETGMVTKRYLALTQGAPPEDRGDVTAPLASDVRRPGRMRVDLRGKACRTEYAVLERWRSGHALLRLTPRTGRTHQIRVHLAHLGCPVLADAHYGRERGLYLSDIKPLYRAKASVSERPLVGRLALHAEELELLHPASGERLILNAPLPADFALALRYLRRYQATPATG